MGPGGRQLRARNKWYASTRSQSTHRGVVDSRIVIGKGCDIYSGSHFRTQHKPGSGVAIQYIGVVVQIGTIPTSLLGTGHYGYGDSLFCSLTGRQTEGNVLYGGCKTPSR